MKKAMRLRSKLDQTIVINGYKPITIDVERVYIHDNGLMSGSFINNNIASNKQRIHVVYENGVWRENTELNKAVQYNKVA